MAVVDNGATAIFVHQHGGLWPARAGAARTPATGLPAVFRKATVLRLELSIPEGKPPVLMSQTVVGEGFAARADLDNFLLGPTGLALSPDKHAVCDGRAGQRPSPPSPNATTRTDSGGTGKVVDP